MATKEKDTKIESHDSKVRKVKVLMRDDRNFPSVKEVEAVYETDKSVSEILQHAWVIEVRDNLEGIDGLEVIKD